MSLKSTLLGLFRTEQEKLSIFLQPRAAMIRGVDLNEYHSVYQSFIDKLEDALSSTHRAQLYSIGDSGSLGHDYTFLGRDVKVVYRVEPLASGQNAPIIYVGELIIQQPEIDLDASGKLIHRTKNIGLIAQSEVHGLLIKHSKGKKVLGRGNDLLNKLNIELEEGCRYFAMSGVIGWAAVDLKRKK